MARPYTIRYFPQRELEVTPTRQQSVSRIHTTILPIMAHRYSLPLLPHYLANLGDEFKLNEHASLSQSFPKINRNETMKLSAHCGILTNVHNGQAVSYRLDPP
jgi:hypothetical protein